MEFFLSLWFPLTTDIHVNDGSASYTVRINTWWVPRRWTSWINFCDTIIRRGWRRGRPWSIPTSVSHEIIHCPLCSPLLSFIINLPLSAADPVVKDQSRMVGSSNVPALNTAVSAASLITGKSRKWGHAEPHTLSYIIPFFPTPTPLTRPPFFLILTLTSPLSLSSPLSLLPGF